MERKKSHLSRWVEGTDLTQYLSTRRSLVEIADNRRVLIENHKGVILYTKEKIKIATYNGKISICGTNLKLECLTKFQLVVSGCIFGVSMEMGS